MKKLFSMRKEIEKILKDIGLKEINIRWTYNDRLSKVIAKVSYENGIRHPTLTVGSKLLKQSDDMKIRVLKHEIAHIYMIDIIIKEYHSMIKYLRIYVENFMEIKQ